MAPNFHEASTRNCFVIAESVFDDLHLLLNRSTATWNLSEFVPPSLCANLDVLIQVQIRPPINGNRQLFFTEQARATQEICIVQEHNHHGKKGTNLSCSLGGTFENRLRLRLLSSLNEISPWKSCCVLNRRSKVTRDLLGHSDQST